MRELKFRAYIEENGRKSFEFIDLNATNTDELARFHAVANKSGVIKEQYTGLKDKNGKEIYEGDIVQIDDHILGDFEVIWHNLGWKIKRSVGYETLAVHKSENCVVVGNIHENPELLKEEE